MILDTMDNAVYYYNAHPGFARAFEYLRGQDLQKKALGTYEIDGKNIFVIINIHEGLGRAGTLAEAHKNYIDIQVTLSGTECIGHKSLEECCKIQTPYNVEKDCEFYSDEIRSWFLVPEGMFAIFFPQDVHAPLAGEGSVKKAVVKVKV